MSENPPVVVLKPVIPVRPPSQLGGTNPVTPPNPPAGSNWEQLVYLLLQHMINPGQLQGNSQYQTLNAASTYQRLFGNQQSAPNPYVISFVQNLSPDPLTLGFANPNNANSQPQDTALGHGRVLNAAPSPGTSGGWVFYPNIDFDRVWIIGATKGDQYYLEWYL